MSTWILSISKERDYTTSFEQPLPIFNQPHSKKKCFLMFRWNFKFLNMHPLPLTLSLGTVEKSMAQSFSFLPIKHKQIGEVPPEPSPC